MRCYVLHAADAPGFEVDLSSADFARQLELSRVIHELRRPSSRTIELFGFRRALERFVFGGSVASKPGM